MNRFLEEKPSTTEKAIMVLVAILGIALAVKGII